MLSTFCFELTYFTASITIFEIFLLMNREHSWHHCVDFKLSSTNIERNNKYWNLIFWPDRFLIKSFFPPMHPAIFNLSCFYSAALIRLVWDNFTVFSVLMKQNLHHLECHTIKACAWKCFLIWILFKIVLTFFPFLFCSIFPIPFLIFAGKR